MKQFLGAVLLFLCAIVAATAYAQKPVTPAPPVTPVPPAQAAGYVGDDTCVACHDNKDKQLAATLHGKSQNPRTPAANGNQACETCHGPGKEHSESGDKAKIRVFTTMRPR